MTTARPRSSPVPRPEVSAALLVAAILLLALNLRGPLVAVAAVLDPIRADLGIDAATAGLLTSLPVLCFGLATPLASAVLARTGLRRGVLLALAVLSVGIVVRSLDGLPAAITGTLLLGIAITMCNVAVPVVIGRDLRERSGAVLGAYTAALNVGSMLTLSLTAPIAGVTGWRTALASWGLLAVVAAVVWWYALRGPTSAAVPAAPASPTGRSRSGRPRPIAWWLTAAFAGQAFAYYGVTAWLPQLLRDELAMTTSTAGAASSIFQVAAIGGAFGVPLLLRYCPGPRHAVLAVCAAWTALPLGLLLAPELWALWCVVGGAAQGGGLTVIFSLVVRAARDETENRRMSALVQGGGYTVAAAGPPVLGAVHAATGGWSSPLLVVLAAIAVLTVAGVVSAPRPRR